jgi:hypothetical protein
VCLAAAFVAFSLRDHARIARFIGSTQRGIELVMECLESLVIGKFPIWGPGRSNLLKARFP